MPRLTRTFEQLRHDLHAFMAACRTRPSGRAVHSLRTSTRRMEALLRNVFEEHPRTTRLHGRMHHALDALKQVRKGAGRVRDLDVQRMLVAEISAGRSDMGSIKKREAWDEQCAELESVLHRSRKRESVKLMSLIEDAEPSLERALHRTVDAIKTVDDDSALKIDTLTRLGNSLALTDTSEDGLHRYRKRIKAARYLIEMLDESSDARRVVNHLKEILDSIGRWHDLLLLDEEATLVLGKRAVLTQAIRAKRDSALRLAIDVARPVCSPHHHQQPERTTPL